MSSVRLVDVGSTVIKICTSTTTHGVGPVTRIPRDPQRAPGRQVLDLVAASGDADLPMRACSSANGGLRVGVVGLTYRHSVRAAVAAVADGGGNLVYRQTLGEPAPAIQPVDALVVAGGVDGSDLAPLRAAVQRFNLDAYPHDVLIWAGADDPASTRCLSPAIQVPNVLDRALRPATSGLAGAVRDLYLSDLVDRKGLADLAAAVSGPIEPTPVVVGAGVTALVTDPLVRALAPGLAEPMVVVDVGARRPTCSSAPNYGPTRSAAPDAKARSCAVCSPILVWLRHEPGCCAGPVTSKSSSI
ncbi:glutamate mutase L [Micromonospora sp. STR1_7]|uniref:Glutamate mutase L n=1 Tax=Micromonospora parastrephiae TaxID=2806101 RepID=A0ABS1XN50_9ACTN|nr:glutamate mutase L [Micromonospora parastrephiae]MBM0230690.1 glutamate mutase L [Micromonospora parastrephiae]